MNATPSAASCALTEVSAKAPGQQVVRATRNCAPRCLKAGAIFGGTGSCPSVSGHHKARTGGSPSLQGNNL